MEEAEPPECPVCLQIYDAVSYIPRVLTCGHTTCEACLKHLPNPFPNTIRCTVCTLLVKFPNCPSSLPKNLDLLHFSTALQQSQSIKGRTVISPPPPAAKTVKNQTLLSTLTLKSWSYEFYCNWRKWVLPKDCILIEKLGLGNDGGKVLRSFESDYVIGCVLRENEMVGLVKLGVFMEDEQDSRFFNSSYESRIMSVLWGMSEHERNELEIILSVTFRVCNVGKANGFWYNDDDSCVYIVFEKFGSSNLMKFVLKEKEDDEDERFNSDEMRGFGMLGMELCEIFRCLHFEGLVIGCLGVSCFGFNEFGRVYIDLSEVLNICKRVVMTMPKGRKDFEVSVMNNLLDNNLVFISPEVLSKLIIKHGFELDWGESKYEVGCASDVWSLACLLVWLILGSSFVEEIKTLLNCVIDATSDNKGCNFSEMYMNWMEKIEALLRGTLGSKRVSLHETLCRSLDLDPKNRPLITEIWKCFRELVIIPQFDMKLSLKKEVKNEKSVHCVVLGEMCRIVEKIDKEMMDGGDEAELRVNGDIIEGVSKGHVKCVEMKGHLDCITGLAIGGDYLFSSSYDKIVRVWSLQDFTHLHSFKSHEHRIMAIVYVNGVQPLCISGDNEGVICIWKANFPFPEMPLKKLYEKKDWRYSGIHAMAVSGTEYLYTGSGDKLVKAWSLQDHKLSCEMSGHKSIVSSLIVCNGVLYSGSWDGTVRLWSLSDHSPITVLGEDKGKLGNVASVLSLSAENNSLFVGHENGSIKIWHNDVLMKSIQAHKGAVFSVRKNGKWLFSGGWDKTINVQEIPEDVNDVNDVDVASVGSIACNSTITVLEYWQGKLFVGQADRIIKIYYGA